MSVVALGKSGTQWYDEFLVLDANGAGVTGVLAAAFTTALTNDGVSSAQAVTITEVGSGFYQVTFTPNATGRWNLSITHATYGQWVAFVRVLTRDQDDHAFPLTSGRGELVNADGSVAPDWSNVKSPATVLDLSGTTIKNLDNAPPGGLTAANVSAAVWDEPRSSHTTAGSFGLLGGLLARDGTAQGGAATTITLDAGASATTDFYKYGIVVLTGGTGAGQSRLVTAYNGTTKVATISPAWTTAPDATSKFAVCMFPGFVQADVEAWVGNTGLQGLDASGFVPADVLRWGGATGVPNALVSGNVLGDVRAWVGSAPNALVAGRVDASVGAVAGGAITSAAFAAGAITNSVLAAGAISASTFAANALGAVWDELRSAHVTAGTFGLLGGTIARDGTAQAGAASSITLDAGASATTDFYRRVLVTIYSGTGAGQARYCTAYNGTTKVATVSPSWTTAPDATSKFVLFATGLPGVDWGNLENPNASNNLFSTSIASVTGNVSGFVGGDVKGNLVGDVQGKVLGGGISAFTSIGVRADVEQWLGSAPNALVAGRVDASIGAVAAGAIVAASFGAGALGAVWDELTASHVTASTFGVLVGTNLDAKVSTRAAPSDILVTPANKLATDASGRVTVGSIVNGAIVAATFGANALGAVWDELLASHVVANSFGSVLGTNVDAKTSTRATPAQILATPANLLATDASGRVTVGSNADKTGYALTAAEHTAIAGDVWNAARASYAVAGSFGQGVASVQGNVTGAVASVSAAVTVGTNNDKTGYSLTAAEEAAVASQVWTVANAIDATLTPALALTYVFAAVAGVSAGEPAGAQDTFKGPSGVVRVSTTYDASNNRTAVALT